MTSNFKTYCTLMLLTICSFVNAQQLNLGLLFSDIDVTDGYTLFTPERNQSTYLINNCGEKINEWTFTEKPGLTCYLLNNGNLLRAGKDSLEIRDWNNNLIWSYAMNNNGLLQHHDIEPLPNGNILCVITDTYTNIEMIAEGRDSSITNPSFRLDKIVELQPLGTSNANIVWEWKFIDHLIQDFDASKSNFGIVANHPELLDINFDEGYTSDWTHVNAIDFNPTLNQILISTRHLNEIYIIDHSTSSLQATGHSGGNSNMGGDFLWRWGNPAVYKQGSAQDQKLFLQHDSRWVDDNYLDGGKISVFNNGGDSTNLFSSVHLITPDIVGGVYTKDSGKFKPLNFEWSWNGSILGDTVFESKKSGAHSLPNGNFIVCETSLGRFSEINKNGDHLWSYRNPTGSVIYDQFDTITTADNGIFRAEKYPINFIGFAGQNLTPQGIIEDQNSISDTCNSIVSIEEFEIKDLSIINPINNNFIEFNKTISLDKIKVLDLNGRLIFEQDYFQGNRLAVKLNSSMYFIHLYKNDQRQTIKFLVN